MSFQVYGKKLASDIPLFSHLPHRMSSVDDIKLLLQYIDRCQLCCGNNDDRFLTYIQSKDGKIVNITGMKKLLIVTQCISIRDVYLLGTTIAFLDSRHSTIHCTDCCLLTSPDDSDDLCCSKCKGYRSNLRALLVIGLRKEAQLMAQTQVVKQLYLV